MENAVLSVGKNTEACVRTKEKFQFTPTRALTPKFLENKLRLSTVVQMINLS
jgi:hypothetical protein